MLGKVFFSVVFAIGILCSAFDIVRDGHACCVIAMPDEPGDYDIIARDDLQHAVELISSAKLEAVSESELAEGKYSGKPAIYIGRTKFAAGCGIDANGLGREEWIIKTTDNALVLTGGGVIGPYYAVQALLRKLGYYMLTMDAECYPKSDTVSAVDCDERKSPAFAGRYIHDAFPETAYWDGMTNEHARAYNLFLLRNMQNGNGQNAGRFRPFYTGDCYDFHQFPPFHSLNLYVPPDVYFDTHPEYYSMDEHGNRVRPGNDSSRGCLCMSNPDVARVTLEKLRSMISEERGILPPELWPRIYDISLLDNFPYICKCPSCKAVIEEEGGEDAGGNTGLMLRYVNSVAGELAKEYPDVIIRVFAYACCRMPCSHTKPAKNIMIQYCDLFSSGDSYRPLTSKFNSASLKYLKGWAETGARLMVWDYWNMAGQPPKPETVIDTLQPDLQLFKENNVECLFIEAEREHYCAQNFIDLNYFLVSQLMNDPYQDVEKLIDLYLDGYYGDGAKTAKEYLNALREGVRVHPNIQISIRTEHWSFFTAKFARDWYLKLTSAQKALPEPYSTRVLYEKLPLMWAVCSSPLSYQQIFADAGISLDDLEKECYSTAKAQLHRYGWPYTKRHDARLDKAWETVSVKIPVPELFKDVPPERLRLLGYPLYRDVPSHNSTTVPDADAVCGKAYKSAHLDKTRHGAGAVYMDGKHQYCATEFFLENIGTPGQCKVRLDSVPQDEKYHWFRIPGTYDMDSLSYFWGHGWGLQMNISNIYVIADGISDVNKWQGWFRAKFTGPAYVPGSTQEDAIWIDIVALTRPGEKSLENYPKAGLIK